MSMKLPGWGFRDSKQLSVLKMIHCLSRIIASGSFFLLLCKVAVSVV